MKIYLPTNLDLEADVEGFNKNYIEKYQWIIHTVLHQGYKTEKSFGGYVNLSQQILRRFIGERYCTEVLSQLENSGIIKINKKYSANNFSMSYSLTEKYHGSEIKSVDFTGSKAVKYIYKINNYNRKCLQTYLKTPVIEQLYKNVFKVDIDEERATEYLNFLKAEEKVNEEQYIVGKMAIENISNKDEKYFFTVDEPTGRVYHPIANCPRYIRKFLSHNGQQLIQIDVANCQPMLFIPMLKEYFGKKEAENSYLTDSNTNYTYDISTILSPYVETSTNNISYSDNNLPDDVTRYIDKCSTGMFYEDLMQEFDIPVSERNYFKKEFFGKIFFSQLHRKWEYDLAKKFRNIYPNVYKAVLWYKQKNHADLPIKLQSIESSIIINGVCAKITAENTPDSMPFFCSVHDCIVCLEENVGYIKKLLENELKTVMGFIPKVKVSRFN